MSNHTHPSKSDGKGGDATGRPPLPRVGERAIYRCLEGFNNPATIAGVRSNGTVDIDLLNFRLTRVRWHVGAAADMERRSCVADDGTIAYGHPAMAKGKNR